MNTFQCSEPKSVANTQFDTFHLAPERSDTRRGVCEGAARTAIDLRAVRALTDADWAAAKSRLLEFISVLCDWDRQART